MLSMQGCKLERCTTGQVGSNESEHQGSKTASLRDTSWHGKGEGHCCRP